VAVLLTAGCAAVTRFRMSPQRYAAAAGCANGTG
jgi:hypothetical protein